MFIDANEIWQRPTAYLVKLPPELLDLIVGRCRGHLKAVSCANHKIRQACLRHMFHDIQCKASDHTKHRIPDCLDLLQNPCSSPLGSEIKTLTILSASSTDLALTPQLLQCCQPSQITLRNCTVPISLPYHIFNHTSLSLDHCSAPENMVVDVLARADRLTDLSLTSLRIYKPTPSSPDVSSSRLQILTLSPDDTLLDDEPEFLLFQRLYHHLAMACTTLTRLHLWFNVQSVSHIQQLVDATGHTLQMITLHVVNDRLQHGLIRGICLTHAPRLRNIQCGCSSGSLLFLHETLSSIQITSELRSVQLMMDQMFISQESADTVQRDIQRLVDHQPHSYTIALDDFDVSDLTDVLDISPFVMIAGVNWDWVAPNIQVDIQYLQCA